MSRPPAPRSVHWHRGTGDDFFFLILYVLDTPSRLFVVYPVTSVLFCLIHDTFGSQNYCQNYEKQRWTRRVFFQLTVGLAKV
ncbi:hypothetical protein BDZ89DRAFT_722675 [Hymenopellis radicata]|nr:hypothetical protein BDZ89DRAFT_722675 [Hymenopellis radicata]